MDTYVGAALKQQQVEAKQPRLNPLESAVVELISGRSLASDLFANFCHECGGEGEADYTSGSVNDPDAEVYRAECEACHGAKFAPCPACGVPSEFLVFGDGRCAPCIAVDVAEEGE